MKSRLTTEFNLGTNDSRAFSVILVDLLPKARNNINLW